MADISALQQARYAYSPKLPGVLKAHGASVRPAPGGKTEAAADQDKIRALFKHTYGAPLVTFEPASGKLGKPRKVGVILSGGQAPGGHNVIAGLFDGLQAMHRGSELYGFLGGPSGLTGNKYKVLTGEIVDKFRNTGGFDIIGSGRTKLETAEQFEQAAVNCANLGIDTLVIIGGDDSNTNACMLAEHFLKHEKKIQVIGCPKTIDGDLKNEQIATSFGFDTATKVYSELIGNIQRDAASAKKYWHFIRLMGRSASHITLECALQTQPNAALISEEIQAQKQTLLQVATGIAEIVRQRAAAGKNYGVVLIPEGLVEFIPEIKALIAELNDRLAALEEKLAGCATFGEKAALVAGGLTAASGAAFKSLPAAIQQQLLMDRDPHGNVQVSRIETEKLLIEMVEAILKKWTADGSYNGKFSSQNHFFGYEGRCAAPSNFDADYCYSLGYTAALLAGAGLSGYMAAVRNLAAPAAEWVAGGVPLTMMMNIERRHGADRPVIRKSLVELDAKPFREFAAIRERWAVQDAYVFPGPIQYFGPTEVCDCPTMTLLLENAKPQ